MQASFFLMYLLCGNIQNSYDVDAIVRDSVAMMISKCLYAYGGSEHEYICNAIDYLLKMEVGIQRQMRILRIPVTLAEPRFKSELSSGAYLRDPRRFYFLYYTNLIVENALVTILAGK